MRGEAPLLSVARASDLPAIVAAAMAMPQRARLVDAFRGRAALHFVDTFPALIAALREQLDAADAVIVPARDGNGAEALSLVPEIARWWPRTAIIAYVGAGAQHSTDIRGLAAAGVHQFVFPGFDDSGVALRAILGAARRQCAADWVMHQLSIVVPVKLHPMVQMALARPDAITTVRGLADALGVQRHTLFNWCVGADFLRPEEVLVWARLALVGYYLETTGTTVETIALELSFPSDTALRNSIKRYTGHRATELRRAGGLGAVVEAFARRVAQRRRRPQLHLE
jgi:hypothetical protein